jgi:transcription elongation factor Elf1
MAECSRCGKTNSACELILIAESPSGNTYSCQACKASLTLNVPEAEAVVMALSHWRADVQETVDMCFSRNEGNAYKVWSGRLKTIDALMMRLAK